MKIRWPFAKGKNPHAVALGRKGGLAYAAKRTPEQRQEQSRKGGYARHGRLPPSAPSPTVAEVVATKIVNGGGYEDVEVADVVLQMEQLPPMWEEIALDMACDEEVTPAEVAALYAVGEIVKFSLKR